MPPALLVLGGGCLRQCQPPDGNRRSALCIAANVGGSRESSRIKVAWEKSVTAGGLFCPRM